MMFSMITSAPVPPIQQLHDALSGSQIYRFFHWLYPGVPLLERAGVLYPVAVYPAPARQWEEPDSILRELETKPPERDFVIQDPSYRHFLTNSGRRLKNLPLYTMTEFEPTPSLSFRCSCNFYFPMLDTCDVLEWELRQGWNEGGGTKERDFSHLLAKLPLRQKLHLQVADPLRLGSGRSVGLAVSTLIAYYRDDLLYLWLQQRSCKTSSLQEGIFHVFPSFMVQPSSLEKAGEEFSITYHFGREYLEEVFNRPEFDEETHSYGYFLADPCWQKLQNYLERKEAQFLLTGVGVNLLNLRPEICTLLFIRNPEWFEYHSVLAPPEQRFFLSEEFLGYGNQEQRHGQLGLHLLYSGQDDELMRAAALLPSRIVPSGAAAFWLGIDTLRKILKSKKEQGDV